MTDLCIHFANIFYLASFLSRDMLWLRLLTCLGLVLGIVFFTCQPTPLYGPTVWHFIFLGINLVQIRRLVVERRELELTEEQKRVCEATFQGMSREELLVVLARVMHRSPAQFQDFRRLCAPELTPEERALHDIAFSRLSREEVLNLLTRRLWSSLNRRNGFRWRRRAADTVQAATQGVAPRSSVPDFIEEDRA